MKSFQIKVAIVLLGVFVCQCTSVKMKPMKCRGQPIAVGEDDMNAITDCVKEAVPDVKPDEDAEKVSKAIPKEKMACVGKCIMSKEGLLDDKGIPSKEIMMTKINATMPQDVVPDMDTAVEKCIDEQGKNLDPEDKTCQTYQGLTQCIMVAFVEVCKTPKE